MGNQDLDNSFSQKDHNTWRVLFNQQSILRDQQIIPEFGQGLDLLQITATGIPNLDVVNKRLESLTGWQGVYVDGFKEAKDFFKLLANKKFPIGNFIRDSKDLSYTPEPDVFHDLYGHLPFYTIKEYANFCSDFGARAICYAEHAEVMDQFQRLFWFGLEFGLIKTNQGRRIFGAGIVSSFTECAYALSDKPRILPFDVKIIRHTPFRIDILQEVLFEIDNYNQIYSCLDIFEKELK